MNEPKNSLIKQYQELFKLEGAKLSFKDNAIKEIATKAINKKTGARGLRSILENILLKTMFDLPSQDNVEEVIIDANAVKGQSNPILVHSKNTKSKIAKDHSSIILTLINNKYLLHYLFLYPYSLYGYKN